MTKPDPIWTSAIADIFLNLSAAWFGLVVVTPVLTKNSSETAFMLATNIGLGIVSVAIAVKLRKL